MDGQRPPRIVDLVFAPELPGRRRRLALAVAVVLAVDAGALALADRLGHLRGAPGGDPAARPPRAGTRELALDVTPPAAPPASPASRPPPRAALAPLARRAPGAVARGRVSRAAEAHPEPAPPGQAGRLAAVSDQRVDFTGSAFIVGSGPSYAGGVTSGAGRARTPAIQNGEGHGVPGGIGGGAGPPGRRARAVSLDQASWSCPWPAEADAQQVDEQTVVLRVAVRPDGGAARVEVVSDPGFGFGAAARLCALATRFEAAHDESGRPIAALSPPIRVHFFR